MSWPSVPLGTILELKYGKSLKANERSGGAYSVLGSNGLVGTHSTGLTRGRTVVIGRKGSIGKMAYAPSACWPIDTTYFIDESSTEQDLRWLFWQLQLLGLDEMNKSAAVPGLNRDDVYRTTIPLPPLAEQRRISAVLDAADKIRLTRSQSLSMMDELAESSFSELILRDGDQKSAKIGDIAHVQTGPFGSLLHREDYVSGGIPLVNPMHIADGQIRIDPDYAISEAKYAELRAYALQPGDVVLGRRGEMGRAAEVLVEQGRLICGTGSMIIRPMQGRVTGGVLARLLATPTTRESLERRAQGATMLNLNQAIVSETLIDLPPFVVQVEYAKTRSALEKSKSLQSMHLLRSNELFESLQNRAFTGRL